MKERRRRHLLRLRHEGRDDGQEEVSGPGRRWQLSATFAGASMKAKKK